MSSLRGVTIKEGRIGQNVAGDQREFGLLVEGVAVPGKIALNEEHALMRVSDAEAIGIDADYDTANNVVLYRHITEFYRMCGEGRKLHIMLVGQGLTTDQITDAAKSLAVYSKGMIADMAIALNPAAVETTHVNGLPQTIYELIPKTQAFAQWAWDNDMPLHVVLEGRNITPNVAGLVNLREFTMQVSGENVALEACKVTLVVGQDYVYAETLGNTGKLFSDVGNYLGVLASQAWNRNPGEWETQNLTAAPLGKFMVGGLSNHKKYSEVYADLETMNDKGYVFPIEYQGSAGYWWNDGHVCAPVVMDAQGNMNQHTIYYSHTMNECKRSLRKAYLPEVKKPVELDENGKLPSSMIEYYNSIGNILFESLASKGLISNGKSTTDSESDLLIEKVLKVAFAVIPTGCVNEIIGTINLKAK